MDFEAWGFWDGVAVGIALFPVIRYASLKIGGVVADFIISNRWRF